MKIAVVFSDYYSEITTNLISAFKAGCDETFNEIEYLDYEVFGVSEIPYVLNKLEKVDAIAVFGCVVQGETFHHELINNYVYSKVYDYSIKNSVPLGYGILNVKTLDQALERSKLNSPTNRGVEAYEAIKFLLDYS
jgi:6,7-dimethyl-8-ribityllumazine synthase